MSRDMGGGCCGIDVVPIQEDHIPSFHTSLDSVCRERKYLARYEAPPLKATRAFVVKNIKSGAPQFVAVDGDRVVGWCDVSLSDKPVFRRSGNLGIGVVAEYRGQSARCWRSSAAGPRETVQSGPRC